MTLLLRRCAVLPHLPLERATIVLGVAVGVNPKRVATVSCWPPFCEILSSRLEVNVVAGAAWLCAAIYQWARASLALGGAYAVSVRCLALARMISLQQSPEPPEDHGFASRVISRILLGSTR